jgi:2-oxoglutarate dehydrogenase E2 component (dihydrolipoamide succinyltransferase)
MRPSRVLPRVAALRTPCARLNLRAYSALVNQHQAPALTQLPRFVPVPFSIRPFHSTSIYHAESIVKVPEMAESISEGTLKQFSKQVGDYVERDEEIATIETDKIDVSVNAPEAGTIKEFLAKEEDTVTVGQDLVRLETGGSAPEGGAKEAKSEPKEAASDKQETSSQPDGGKEKEQSKPAQKEEKKEEPKSSSPPPQPKQESKELPKDKAAPQPPAKKEEPGQKQQPFESKKTEPQQAGSREERRVCGPDSCLRRPLLIYRR